MVGNETYTLKLLIDDSAVKALEQRLAGIMGVKGGSGSSSGGDTSNMVKNITKLGVIAAGVGGLLELVKKITQMTISASPMLQAMLKLFDTSIMLILRPIGDFIGFTLRPIMLFFLQYVALPFYRYFTPWMQKYGTKLGDGLLAVANLLVPKDAKNKITTIGPIPLRPEEIKILNDDIDGLKKGIKSFTDALNPQGLADFVKTYVSQWKTLFDGIIGVFTKISSSLTPVFGVISATMKIVSDAWSSFMGWIGSVNITIKPIVDAWDMLVGLFQGVGAGFKTLTNAWDKLWSFFSVIGKDISDVLGKGWKALTDFFKMIQDFFNDPLGFIQKNILHTSSNTPQSNSNTPVSSSSNPGVNVENLVVHTALQLESDAQNFLKDPKGFISKIVQQSLSRLNTR